MGGRQGADIRSPHTHPGQQVHFPAPYRKGSTFLIPVCFLKDLKVTLVTLKSTLTEVGRISFAVLAQPPINLVTSGLFFQLSETVGPPFYGTWHLPHGVAGW